jgi:hypothetical protein
MRVIQPTIITAAILLATSSASLAQSPYDYPWCAVFTRTSGATSCYYTSFQQCRETLSGIGGDCIQNPGYRGPALARPYPPYRPSGR